MSQKNVFVFLLLTSCLYIVENHPMVMEKPITQER